MTEKQFKPPWQPMSTAPKGPQILLWRFGNVLLGKWDGDKCSKHPKPYWSSFGSIHGVHRERNTEPTAWMPLPDAPEEMPQKPLDG